MAYTTIDDTTIYFTTKLYTGNVGTNAITGDGSSKTFKALCTKNLAEYG